MLVLLFVKYVFDKYAGQKDVLLDVPVGGRFADMVALKGDQEIGDKINKITREAIAEELREAAKRVTDLRSVQARRLQGKGKAETSPRPCAQCPRPTSQMPLGTR